MIRLFVASVVMMVLALGCLTGSAQAQSGPIAPAQQTNVEQKLTEEQLIAQLSKLDASYKLFPLKNAKGEEIGKNYRVVIDHKGTKYHIDMHVSRGAIWMHTNVARIFRWNNCAAC